MNHADFANHIFVKSDSPAYKANLEQLIDVGFLQDAQKAVQITTLFWADYSKINTVGHGTLTFNDQ